MKTAIGLFTSMGYFDWTANRDSTGVHKNRGGGGRNIAADSMTTVPHVDMEWVIEQNPEIIVYSMSQGQYHGSTPTIEEMEAKRKEIMSLPGFENIDAVKTGRVYYRYKDGKRALRAGCHALLCQVVHPDLFQIIDPRTVHEELLRKYFDMDTTAISAHLEAPVELSASDRCFQHDLFLPLSA